MCRRIRLPANVHVVDLMFLTLFVGHTTRMNTLIVVRDRRAHTRSHIVTFSRFPSLIHTLKQLHSLSTHIICIAYPLWNKNILCNFCRLCSSEMSGDFCTKFYIFEEYSKRRDDATFFARYTSN